MSADYAQKSPRTLVFTADRKRDTALVVGESTTNSWVLGMQTPCVGDKQCKSTSMVVLQIFQQRGTFWEDSYACCEYICFLSFWRSAKPCKWGLRMYSAKMVNRLSGYCLLSKVVSIGNLNQKTSETSYLLPRSNLPVRCMTSTWARNSPCTNISWTAMTKGPLSEAFKLRNLRMTDHGRPLQSWISRIPPNFTCPD